MKNDLSGLRFGRLIAIERTGEKKWGCFTWQCKCDCGNTHIVASNTLKAGLVRSCGCLASDVSRAKGLSHGMFGTPTYRSWDSMIQRCTNPSQTSYKNYGGRGISVCQEWLSFQLFFNDMGERPDGSSLDRIDNNLGYSPQNCRWATHSQQAQNKRTSKISIKQADQIRSLRSKTGWGVKRILDGLGLDESYKGAVNGVIYLGQVAGQK